MGHRLLHRALSDGPARWIALVVLTLVILVLVCQGQQPEVWQGQRRQPQDVYAKFPFCQADGTCHEVPDQPSPRSKYSCWTRHQCDQWWHFHAQLSTTAAQYDSMSTGRPLVLLGDSITEAWLGTAMGEARQRAHGVPQVLKQWMEDQHSVWRPLVLAISGDQTQHLLWRLQNGELSTMVAQHAHALFVLLVGTNNLGSGELPGPTAQGILAIVDYLAQLVRGKILVVQVLPRGDGPALLPKLCPPRCQKDGSPFTSFLPAVEKVNGQVHQGVVERYARSSSFQDKVALLDCGDAFLQQIPSGEQVDTTLMPDRLHPNAAGHELLVQCISKWMKENIVLSQ